jgi:hypothetical protein
MAAVMIVILPYGPLIFRVFGGIWVYEAIQIFGLCAMIAGFGLGIRVAQMSGYVGVLFETDMTKLTVFTSCLTRNIHYSAL